MYFNALTLKTHTLDATQALRDRRSVAVHAAVASQLPAH